MNCRIFWNKKFREVWFYALVSFSILNSGGERKRWWATEIYRKRETEKMNESKVGLG